MNCGGKTGCPAIVFCRRQKEEEYEKIMMALNFRAEKHRKMLLERRKKCTVRLGDVSAQFPESSVVWITTGQKGEPKEKLYTAYLDKVRVKTMGTLSTEDLDNQNPEITTREDLIADFEKIYNRRIIPEDTVTVIYFTEVVAPL